MQKVPRYTRPCGSPMGSPRSVRRGCALRTSPSRTLKRGGERADRKVGFSPPENGKYTYATPRACTIYMCHVPHQHTTVEPRAWSTRATIYVTLALGSPGRARNTLRVPSDTQHSHESFARRSRSCPTVQIGLSKPAHAHTPSPHAFEDATESRERKRECCTAAHK